MHAQASLEGIFMPLIQRQPTFEKGSTPTQNNEYCIVVYIKHMIRQNAAKTFS